ncbi:hypothetical protein CVT25_007686 [Psilocybe cyanescens]|uniref:Uncharacterized protein n=1 Tax=Psilocybe cyanescens TaxID=93625 RepID=A0A409XVF2_PSICY|nr:hypothetical protein CVT25_007686 [Psilocybe cyanescens]
MAAAMCMNSNTLAIALMPSYVVSVPNLAWGSDDNKNCADVTYSYGVSLFSQAYTILLPPVLSSATPPFTPILGLDTDCNTEDKGTPLPLDIADDDKQVGDGDKHDFRMHAASSTLMHLHSNLSASKKGASQCTESPTPSALSSPLITSLGVAGAPGSASSTGTSANSKGPQTQRASGQGHAAGTETRTGQGTGGNSI